MLRRYRAVPVSLAPNLPMDSIDEVDAVQSDGSFGAIHEHTIPPYTGSRLPNTEISPELIEKLLAFFLFSLRFF